MAQSNMTQTNLPDERLHVAFRLADVHSRHRLTPVETKAAFKELGICIQEKEAKIIVMRFDLSGDGLLSLDEFIRCIRSPHQTKILTKKFEEQDILKHKQLSRSQMKEALRQLGHVFSQDEFNSLFSRFPIPGENLFFNFDVFKKMTSAAILSLYEKPITGGVPLKPAGWNEVVLSTHTVIGVFITSILVFFPFKIAEKTANPSPSAPPSTQPNIPFLSQSTKTEHDRGTDTLLMVCLCVWAGTFILSLRARGYLTGKSLDIISIGCGLLILLSLISYVNGWGAIFLVVFCFFACVALALMRHWE